MTRLTQRDVYRLFRVMLGIVEAGSESRGDYLALAKLARWLHERGWRTVEGPGSLERWALDGEAEIEAADRDGYFSEGPVEIDNLG